MQKWAMRQFLDARAKYPERFSFLDAVSGATLFTRDLAFVPGHVAKDGTYLHRGHFMPLEEWLAAYGLEGEYDGLQVLLKEIYKAGQASDGKVDALEKTGIQLVAALQQRISGLSARAGAMESKVNSGAAVLANYAPKVSPCFINPLATASPAGGDASSRIATTASVRALVGQYPFLPKDVRNQRAANVLQTIQLTWNDPTDFIYDNMTLSTWAGTKVVYRVDRYPVNEMDGTLLVDSKVRDWHTENPAVVEENETPRIYYFGFFPYSSAGAYNRRSGNRAAAIVEYVRKTLYGVGYRTQIQCEKNGVGSVLFGGGLSIPGGQTDDVTLYTTQGNKATLSPLSEKKNFHAVSRDGYGSVLFAGGFGISAVSGLPYVTDTVDRYTTDNIRASLLPLFARREYLGGAVNGNGAALFAGGYNSASSSQYYAYVDAYTPDGARVSYTPLSEPCFRASGTEDGLGNAVFSFTIALTRRAPVNKFTPDGLRIVLAERVARTADCSTRDKNGNTYFGGTHIDDNTLGIDRYSPDGTKTTLPKGVTGDYATMDANGNAVFLSGNNIRRIRPDGSSDIVAQTTGGVIRTCIAADGNGDIIAGGGDSGYFDKFIVYKGL